MFRRQAELIGLLFLAAVIAALNWYANAHFLYFAFWWFDVLMHFLGGFFVGWACLFSYHYIGREYVDQRPARLFLVALLGTLIVGVLWEVFEGYVGIHLVERYIVSDTLLDLFMDTLGALGAWSFFLLTQRTPLRKSTDNE